MSFAKLGTRSEGGWSANSPTPVGPSAYAASLAKKVRATCSLGCRGARVPFNHTYMRVGPSAYSASLAKKASADILSAFLFCQRS